LAGVGVHVGHGGGDSLDAGVLVDGDVVDGGDGRRVVDVLYVDTERRGGVGQAPTVLDGYLDAVVAPHVGVGRRAAEFAGRGVEASPRRPVRYRDRRRVARIHVGDCRRDRVDGIFVDCRVRRVRDCRRVVDVRHLDAERVGRVGRASGVLDSDLDIAVGSNVGVGRHAREFAGRGVEASPRWLVRYRERGRVANVYVVRGEGDRVGGVLVERGVRRVRYRRCVVRVPYLDAERRGRVGQTRLVFDGNFHTGVAPDISVGGRPEYLAGRGVERRPLRDATRAVDQRVARVHVGRCRGKGEVSVLVGRLVTGVGYRRRVVDVLDNYTERFARIGRARAVLDGNLDAVVAANVSVGRRARELAGRGVEASPRWLVRYRERRRVPRVWVGDCRRDSVFSVFVECRVTGVRYRWWVVDRRRGDVELFGSRIGSVVGDERYRRRARGVGCERDIECAVATAGVNDIQIGVLHQRLITRCRRNHHPRTPTLDVVDGERNRWHSTVFLDSHVVDRRYRRQVVDSVYSQLEVLGSGQRAVADGGSDERGAGLVRRRRDIERAVPAAAAEAVRFDQRGRIRAKGECETPRRRLGVVDGD